MKVLERFDLSVPESHALVLSFHFIIFPPFPLYSGLKASLGYEIPYISIATHLDKDVGTEQHVWYEIEAEIQTEMETDRLRDALSFVSLTPSPSRKRMGSLESSCHIIPAFQRQPYLSPAETEKPDRSLPSTSGAQCILSLLRRAD